MIISVIAAIGENRELGFGNKLLWHLPDDLKRFKEITRGHSVITGRRTYESIGRLLPDRKNIIITRNKNFKVEDAVIVSDFEEALEKCKGEDEVFVIGGGEVYKEALPHSDKLYLTEVESEFEADTHFPAFDKSEWKKMSEEFHPKDEKHLYDFTFKIYEKKS